MQSFEFVIPSRPVSQQAKSPGRQRWQTFVRQEAQKNLPATHQQYGGPVLVTLICLFDEVSMDLDNIIKPILDALNGLVYIDDALVTDIIARKRNLRGTFDLSSVSPILRSGFAHGGEFVYIKISDAPPQRI